MFSTIPSPRLVLYLVMFAALARTALIVIVYLGAFSRFTHGEYTPSFYQYQLDLAPDNDSTRLTPVADAVLVVQNAADLETPLPSGSKKSVLNCPKVFLCLDIHRLAIHQERE